jgi:heterotetrameric sarcosine oxidase delta subunit
MAYLGEFVHRPETANVDPAEWRRYLYMRQNPASPVTEQWFCRAGCRRFFLLERDTFTNRFTHPPLPVDWYDWERRT